MFVIKHKNIFFAITALLMLASIIVTVLWRPNLSIEFTGGTVLEGEYTDSRPDVVLIKEQLGASFETAKVQPVGDKGLLVRTRDLGAEEHRAILASLTFGDNIFTENNLSTIGPSIGTELRSKALLSLVLVLSIIILFIAFAFRSASMVVSSWKFGLSVIVCLVHDIFVPTGVFVILSHYFVGYEIDTLFVTALLAILGYSVADTIVVFDRIRENLKLEIKESFPELVGRSLSETYTRSINTSFTTILAALAIFFFGGETTRHFALMLAVGIAAGTYSSILLASPFLVLISGKK